MKQAEIIAKETVTRRSREKTQTGIETVMILLAGVAPLSRSREKTQTGIETALLVADSNTDPCRSREKTQTGIETLGLSQVG